MIERRGSTGFQLQARDIHILLGLFESRLMTLQHVAVLFFDRSFEAAKKRVQKLKSAGLIAERTRLLFEPSILSFTRQAFAILSGSGHLADYPNLSWKEMERRADVSEQTIRHELEVMDAKATMFGALRVSQDFILEEFTTWPRLYEFKALTPAGEPTIVKPDGFIRVREDRGQDLLEHRFFLEVDRSSEAQRRLVTRAHQYLNYYQNGGLAIRNGRPASEYKRFPFRVLMIFKSEERRDNAAVRMAQSNPPIHSLVWMTTRDEFQRDPFGPIWLRPIDYRKVLMEAIGPVDHLATAHKAGTFLLHEPGGDAQRYCAVHRAPTTRVVLGVGSLRYHFVAKESRASGGRMGDQGFLR